MAEPTPPQPSGQPDPSRDFPQPPAQPGSPPPGTEPQQPPAEPPASQQPPQQPPTTPPPAPPGYAPSPQPYGGYPNPQGPYPPPWVHAQQVYHQRVVRNAKQNAIAMFVLFCLGALATGVPVAMILLGADFGGLSCINWAVIAGGVFAAIYLPIRWKVLRSLSPGYRKLGMIGGIGLIVLLALNILSLAVTFMLLPS